MSRSFHSVLRTKSAFIGWTVVQRPPGGTAGHSKMYRWISKFQRSLCRKQVVRKNVCQEDPGAEGVITWEVNFFFFLSVKCATFSGICWCNGQCICLFEIVTSFITYSSIYNSETPQLVVERRDIRKRVCSSSNFADKRETRRRPWGVLDSCFLFGNQGACDIIVMCTCFHRWFSFQASSCFYSEILLNLTQWALQRQN